MRKSLRYILYMAALAVISASPAFAEAQQAAAAHSSGGSITFFTTVAIVSAFGMTIATATVGFAQSNAVKAAVEGIARNPGASGKILPTLLIGLAMMESLAIYTLVIALILLFANPFLKFLG